MVALGRIRLIRHFRARAAMNGPADFHFVILGLAFETMRGGGICVHGRNLGRFRRGAIGNFRDGQVGSSRFPRAGDRCFR